MGRQKLDRLCQAVLPPEFERLCRQGPAIQRFLEQNLPEPANASATLLSLNDDEIVIAAHSPAVVGFLRLHQREISQQLLETFGLKQTLRFRSVPESLLRVDTREKPSKPAAVSEQTVDAIRRSAGWVEDEGLKAALNSLADSLQSGREA